MLEKQLCQRMDGFWEGVDSIYCDVKYASQRISQKQQLQEGINGCCALLKLRNPPTSLHCQYCDKGKEYWM